MATKPQYLPLDTNAIVNEMIAYYEAETGRPLQPAQVERLIINMIAYRERLLREQVNEAANLNLVEFSKAPFIDYLGQLVGVIRLPASAASALFSFEFEASHGALIIPAGFTVTSTDGLATFQLQDDLVVAENVATVGDIELVCTTEGIIGNGYNPGMVNTINAPQPFLLDVQNSTDTQGGSDQESDDQLRVRIKLAPDAFSTAGSRGAYEFHARSVSPEIVDVTVKSLTPGNVNIYPLGKGGRVPETVEINAILDATSGEKVRPLCDTVNVLVPEIVNYDIEVNVLPKQNADATTVQDAVTAALNAFGDERKNQLGLSALLVQIIGVVQGVSGVFACSVVEPTGDVTASDIQAIKLQTVTVNIVEGL